MKIERTIREEVTEPLKVIGITLLSVEEYEEAKAYIAPIGHWWWLRSPGDSGSAALVSTSGDVCTGGFLVDVSYGAVRPALEVDNLKSFNLNPEDKIIDLAGHDWTVISDTMALCDDSIGGHCFRENWKAPDANDYEQSDVKRFLESWAAKNGIICGAKMEGGDATRETISLILTPRICSVARKGKEFVDVPDINVWKIGESMMCEREMTREELVAVNNELRERINGLEKDLKEALLAVEHNRNIAQENQLKGELRYRDGLIYGLEYSIRCNGVSGGDI